MGVEVGSRWMAAGWLGRLQTGGRRWALVRQLWVAVRSRGVEAALLVLAGCLLGRAALLGDLYPFGPAALASLLAAGLDRQGWLLAAGVTCGAATVLPPSRLWVPAGEMLLLYLLRQGLGPPARTGRRGGHRRQQARVWGVAAVAGLARLILALLEGLVRGAPLWPGPLVEAILVLLLAVILFPLTRLLSWGPAAGPDWQHGAALAFLAAGLGLGVQGWQLGPVSLFAAWAGYTTLLVATTAGGAAGGVAGMALGLAGTLGATGSSPSPGVAGALGVGGLLAGAFHSGGKVGSTFGFLLGHLVASYQAPTAQELRSAFAAMALGVVGVWLTPAGLCRRLQWSMPGALTRGSRLDSAAGGGRVAAAWQLQQVAEVLAGLGQTLGGGDWPAGLSRGGAASPPLAEGRDGPRAAATLEGLAPGEGRGKTAVRRQQEMAERFAEAIFEGLCRHCASSRLCWGKQVRQTYRDVRLWAAASQERGEVSRSDLPAELGRRCCQPNRLLETAGQAWRRVLLEQAAHEKVEAARSLLPGQLRGAAQLVAGLAQHLPDRAAEPALASLLLEDLVARGLPVAAVEVYAFRPGEGVPGEPAGAADGAAGRAAPSTGSGTGATAATAAPWLAGREGPGAGRVGYRAWTRAWQQWRERLTGPGRAGYGPDGPPAYEVLVRWASEASPAEAALWQERLTAAVSAFFRCPYAVWYSTDGAGSSPLVEGVPWAQAWWRPGGLASALGLGELRQGGGVASSQDGGGAGAAAGWVHLIPEPTYGLQVAPLATAAPGQPVSGDSWACVPCGPGRVALVLSDGMGQGLQAAWESRSAVSLLARLLVAGFNPAFGVQTVNQALLLRATDDRYATLDLALLDLYTGRLTLYKAGSGPSFLRREGEVEIWRSASLPAGVVSGLEVTACQIQLRPGDLLVLATDGLLEGLAGSTVSHGAGDPEEWVARLLAQLGRGGPVAAVEALASAAQRASGQGDDLTLVAARVWPLRLYPQAKGDEIPVYRRAPLSPSA